MYMTTREFKTQLYTQLATVTKALSNPARLEILDLISQGAFPVEYIAACTNLPVANVSQHLQVLRKSGLVNTTRRGKFIDYEIAGSHVLESWINLRRLGFSQNAKIPSLLQDFRVNQNPSDVITDEELRFKLDRAEVILLDVRPHTEFEIGHIPGAVSMPPSLLKKIMDGTDAGKTDEHSYDLKKIKNELINAREIIVYCRSPLCLMADEAIMLLSKHNLRARRLDSGYTGWIEKRGANRA